MSASRLLETSECLRIKDNVRSEKKYTKRSSVLLLCLVYFSAEQTLNMLIDGNWATALISFQGHILQ